MSTEDSDRRRQLRDEFIEARGYWNPIWEALLELDEGFFAAYTSFSSVPWRSGPLEPKVKEFIYCAFDASATHMFAPGLRQHIANAIRYGATAEELMEVFELASGIGVESFAVALPALRDAIESRA